MGGKKKSSKTPVTSPAVVDKGAGDAGASGMVLRPTRFVALAIGAAGAALLYRDPSLWEATHRPTAKAPLEDLFPYLVVSAAFLGVCGLFDMLVAGLAGRGRYFALHTVVNASIVAAVLPDALATLTAGNPYEANTCVTGAMACASKTGIAITVAVHVWHILAYPNLHAVDIVHHVPALIVCALCLGLPWAGVVNFTLVFALMGIPGGIDYALLTLIRLGVLKPRVEKEWNQTLNVWIRCPCAVVSGFIIVGGAISHPEYFTGAGHRMAHALTGVHNVWNGCFFMYRTVDARTRFMAKLKAAKAAKQG